MQQSQRKILSLAFGAALAAFAAGAFAADAPASGEKPLYESVYSKSYAQYFGGVGTVDAAYDGTKDITVTLKPSADGKYMIVGNPYMAPLDLQAFFNENSSLLTGAYWTETENGPGVGGTDGNNWLTPDASSVIPPYGAFFVERKADATGDNTIKFTADMQKFVSDAGSGTGTTAFTITADNETGRSGAVLAYTDNAVNRYEATEDVQLMRNLLGNNAD